MNRRLFAVIGATALTAAALPILSALATPMHGVATERPAPTLPPSSVPSTSLPVETTVTGVSPTPTTADSGDSGQGGPVSTTTLPAPSWPVVDGEPLGCWDPWGRWSHEWCDPRVLQVCVPSPVTPNTLDCRLTPAGEAAAATTTTTGRRLPETAMGSRWA